MNDTSKLPVKVDPVTMAEKSQKIEGSVSNTGLGRLEEVVISIEQSLVANFSFQKSEHELPLITGSIQATVELRCERCLDCMKYPMDLDVEVLLKSDADLRMVEEGVEYYEYGSNGLILKDLIEDELLLALPLVPKHEDISLCNQDMVAWLAANEAPEEKSENPFAILKR